MVIPYNGQLYGHEKILFIKNRSWHEVELYLNSITLHAACVFSYPRPLRKNSQRIQQAGNAIKTWILAWRGRFPSLSGGWDARWTGDSNSGEVGWLGRPSVVEMGGGKKEDSIVCRGGKTLSYQYHNHLKSHRSMLRAVRLHRSMLRAVRLLRGEDQGDGLSERGWEPGGTLPSWTRQNLVEPVGNIYNYGGSGWVT